MERKFLGVCAWLAGKMNLDVNLVRIGFVIATLCFVGTPILIYFVLFLLLHMGWIE
ncbi:phage shock protein C (PspC) family protein [Breznakibacter xylanolyticus]|uniref:Phage shock protein C (PspC) family protein n=1 Tax=Breznakibacter xylanolyticus TaxID=990 RepID=A0A2W7NGR4_9BACT|nr:PspC domain-containing protein [Breznakibacter xylanolyticus]MBN2743137.1 PspC domain-containing protein [Marinilabiliaceae bacterium]PZX15884.1 phage shock protein C (PspC) family protein [Breznakibacter xylanolyticus]